MPLEQSIKDAFEELTDLFYVPDYISDQSTCIFILESPHVMELEHRAPVSGSSGASMSKHLFGEEYGKIPLGRMVKMNLDENLNRPGLNRIGLVNVCNIPMQAAAYGKHPLRTKYADFISRLEQLRTANHQSKFRNETVATLQAVLRQSLERKLKQLTSRPCVLVPCGRFAQKFFRLADVASENWSVIEEVPHPSYNSWDREQYVVPISQLKQAFEAV